jgi:hypothetical protein
MNTKKNFCGPIEARILAVIGDGISGYNPNFPRDETPYTNTKKKICGPLEARILAVIGDGISG